MDFSNRDAQSQAAAPGVHHAAGSSSRNKKDKSKMDRIGTVVVVAAVTLLLAALIALVSFGGDKKESSYVNGEKLQAVFLNTGQVYFGNIKSLNSQYLILTNIYYLQTASNGQQQNANSSVSLVKLGCELHEPYDQMVINREQVTFWENLQDNGQVATAVSTFKKQNPDGQKCADQSSSSSTDAASSTQNAGSNTGNTNNDTTNP